MNDLTVVSSTDRDSRTSGILWGMTKCGKTTFLTSLPGKKLFVMLDPDGDQSIPDRSDVSILKVYEHDDDVVLRYMTKNLPALIKKGEFQSVIIDSLSTLGQVVLNEAIRNEVGASKRDGFVPSLDAPGLSAYGSRTARIVDIVNKALRATAVVGAHCWFTSHEDEPKTNSKGEFLYITMTLSGKSVNGVGINVSEIWHMRFTDGKWWIAIAPCRGKQPMGTRLFSVTGSPEFQLKFDPSAGPDQPHSISRWFEMWVDSGRQKLSLPK